jgi:hypothetical protein
VCTIFLLKHLVTCYTLYIERPASFLSFLAKNKKEKERRRSFVCVCITLFYNLTWKLMHAHSIFEVLGSSQHLNLPGRAVPIALSSREDFTGFGVEAQKDFKMHLSWSRTQNAVCVRIQSLIRPGFKTQDVVRQCFIGFEIVWAPTVRLQRNTQKQHPWRREQPPREA